MARPDHMDPDSASKAQRSKPTLLSFMTWGILACLLIGLIAPLAGMWLYAYIGSWIWVVAIVMSLSSLWLYHDLAEEGDQLAV